VREDGATWSFQIVDVAEGVCIQTQAVIRTAYREGLKIIAVLNKIDRLILEMGVSREWQW
jgi:translation elongation factor EF-G